MQARRFAAVAATSVALLVPAGTALAHECFNASRSEQGNAGAANSQRWLTVHLSEFFGDPSIGLSEAQQQQALALAQERGIPSSFTIFIGTHTIGSNPKTGEPTPAFGRNGKAADGKGIDHIFEAYGDELIAIVIEVGGTPPGP
jgi:hypothetical protein